MAILTEAELALRERNLKDEIDTLDAELQAFAGRIAAFAQDLKENPEAVLFQNSPKAISQLAPIARPKLYEWSHFDRSQWLDLIVKLQATRYELQEVTAELARIKTSQR